MRKTSSGRFRSVFVSVLAGCLIWCATGYAAEKKISKGDENVPPHVLLSFRKSYPQVKDIKWMVKKDTCTARFKHGSDDVRLTIDHAGVILEKVMTVAPNHLPTGVQRALAGKYPGLKVKTVSSVDRKGVVVYEISLTDGAKIVAVATDTEGNVIKQEGEVTVANGATTISEEAPSKLFNWKVLKGKHLKVYGFVQTFYRHAFETGSDGVYDNGNFRVQRVRLGVKGDLAKWLSYEVDIDPRAPEITGVLRDAFFDVKVIPNHVVRIGQQKTTFGYENNVSSSKLFAVNRTEMSDNITRGPNLRDIGVGLIGHIPLANGFRIEDSVTLVNGAGMNVQDDDTRRKSVWGRLGLRYKKEDFWVRLGVSGATGDFMDEGDDEEDPADDVRLSFDRIGFDVEVDHKWFFVSAEYAAGWNDEEDEREDVDGWYINLVGKTPWKIGPIVRYDATATEGTSDYKRWTLGGYYGNPNDRFRVLVNYEIRQKMEDPSGNVGRGDDKFYVWFQFKF